MMKNTLLFFSLLLLASCSNKKSESETTAEAPVVSGNLVTLSEAQLKSAGIESGMLESRNLSSVIKVSGTIDVPPQNMVSVSMPLGGYLKSTQLLPGMHVSKGQVIARMEDQQYIQLQQDYLTTTARLQYAEAEYNRQKDLNQSKASSDKMVQQMQMEYHTQKIALSALAEKLKLININPQGLTVNNLSKSVNIYSPISGFVSKINVNIGKYANPSDVLFELINPSDIHLNLKVFEKDIDKLEIGQQLIAYTNNQPDKKHLCKIILISRDLSPERSAEVHCHFENFDKTLLPGMYMNAEIEIKSHDTRAVKEDAIVSYEGKNYVFAVKSKNQFEMIPAETGTKENGYVAILNTGVFADKMIVSKGAYTLLMALKNKAED
ncbi:efflux RND transporter periplasmic adaptor subunit [Emticicia sp. CRIBPO]|nr:efflux RND transporter periplasmic adaptor subunit [Emticicia sp. CRIBPO]